MDRLSSNALLASLRRWLPPSLPEFLRERRWFAGKARMIRDIEILDLVVMPVGAVQYFLVLVKIDYVAGPAEIYDIPLTIRSGAVDAAPWLKLHGDSGEGLELVDALSDAAFQAFLLESIAQGNSLPGNRFYGNHGDVRPLPGKMLQSVWTPTQGVPPPVLHRGEQSNSSIMYGKSLILKVFRRLEAGINPDLEIGSFLTDRTSFRNIAPVLGSLEYVGEHAGRGPAISLAILQGFIANQGDAWQFTLRQLAGYYADAATAKIGPQPLAASILELSAGTIPSEVRRLLGAYLGWAELLGKRTAEMHMALASASHDPAFQPEPFSAAEQHDFAETAVELLNSTFHLLREQREVLSPDILPLAAAVLHEECSLQERFRLFERAPLSVTRTRIHGDYHLGQVLFTGSDFVIIDFEGEPSRPLAERRKKRSPLQDVAGMLRSFHYAAYAPLLAQESSGHPGDRAHQLGMQASYWQKWISAAFLRSYRNVAGSASFIPKSDEEFSLLLDAYLLDKAVYELAYELNNRPSWVRTPLGGIAQLIEAA
jgi:trehalose synthase-fused probable maltokinase